MFARVTAFAVREKLRCHVFNHADAAVRFAMVRIIGDAVLPSFDKAG